MTVQVATRLDKAIKEKAERIVSAQGLNLNDCLRIFITKIANEQRIPIRIDNRVVSLDGDSFASDQEYFDQIPGFWEEIDAAAAEPIGSGLIYDEKTFWND
ncbi:MAG: type II toxin-antitoxin system RelB/DinJ family antitoxin [Dysgonamonadaceae bacterium]|jgi:addiction module RelB/DinJ family antitoxin|nr:type II toxin-antitoxin system RelB/DinJ family antitoxin [Dysgonamonadaceae bacterium]